MKHENKSTFINLSFVRVNNLSFHSTFFDKHQYRHYFNLIFRTNKIRILFRGFC